VETRVGPQRFKVGLSQTLPWPGRLSAAADSASKLASAARLRLMVEVLRVKRDVAAAYWSLWLINEEHRLKTEHDAVLDSLAAAVRGKLKTGAATLADLSQVELSVARHHDHRGKHEEAAKSASARLLAAIGVAARGETLKVSGAPQPGMPGEGESGLRASAASHPMVQAHDELAESDDLQATAKRAERFPSIRLGLDFIETGAAAMPGVSGSGKDPLIVSAGVSLPLWAGSYSDAEQAARASAAAHRSDREAAMRQAEASFESAHSELRDAQRRVDLYRTTLVPQAESAFRAVLGGYQTGRSTVAAVILAQRDLLELQIEYARSRADHAKAWTALEYVVGRELDGAEGAQ
jgi:outer membrane protein TolC